MYLDDFRLKPIKVTLEPTDIIFVKAEKNQRGTIIVNVGLVIIWIVCAVFGAFDSQGSRVYMFCALIALFAILLAISLKQAKDGLTHSPANSIRTGILSLVAEYKFSDHNTIEIRYPFRKMVNIVVSDDGINIQMKESNELCMPKAMFFSDNDMIGFSEALSTVARCELTRSPSDAD